MKLVHGKFADMVLTVSADQKSFSFADFQLVLAKLQFLSDNTLILVTSIASYGSIGVAFEILDVFVVSVDRVSWQDKSRITISH